MAKKVTADEKVILFFIRLYEIIKINISRYRADPTNIIIDLFRTYHSLKYSFLNSFDPPPKKKRKEEISDYYDRIDPKYGLRYFTLLMSRRAPIDLTQVYADINASDLKESMKIEIKDFFRVVDENNRKIEDKYRRYKIRREFFSD